MWKSSLLLVLSVGLLTIGCKPIEEVTQRKVLPIPSSGVVSGEAIVYVLPRTVIGIQIDYVKVVEKKGPYFNYRKKYLGLNEGISADRSYWNFSQVNVTSTEEIDPNQYFMIQSAEPVYSNYLHLTEKGLVMSPEPGLSNESPAISYLNSCPPNEVYFTDLSVKRNINRITDSAYKQVATDTGFIKVPYLEYKTRLKTSEQKAEEASNFIIKVRKRRFKLLSGQYDVFPEGSALEYAVNRLNKLEEEYLSLFLGKTVKQYYHKSYEWIPDEGNLTKELFWFSEKNGITTKDDPTGLPVILKVMESGPLPLKNMVQPGDSIDTSALIYRVPVPVSLEVTYANKNLFTNRIMVDQLGTLFRLPTPVLPVSGKINHK